MIIATTALFSMGCNSPSTAQPATESVAIWHDELSYGFMDTEDSEEAARAFKVAQKSGRYKSIFSRFNLGNLYIVEGSTPSKEVLDSNGSGGYIGIIMSQNPRVVTLPDKELFAQFMAALRPDPNKLSAERRHRAIRVLAGTGEILTKRDMENNELIQRLKIEPQDPSWTEKDGSLVFHYYSYRSEGYAAPYLVECQLHVDRSQQYTLTCEQVGESES